jgi:transcription initiation protein SPT3
MVRSLCVTALEVRERSERNIIMSQPKLEGKSGTNLGIGNSLVVGKSPMKRGFTSNTAVSASVHESPSKKSRVEFVASPEGISPAPLVEQGPNRKSSISIISAKSPIPQLQSQITPTAHYPVSLFAPPPSARQALMPCHVLEAFAQIQRTQAARRVGGGRGWRGGRARVGLV